MKKETKNKLSDLTKGFTEEQKQELIKDTLTTCSKLLISTCVIVGAENFIQGKVLFPDGSMWVISFKKDGIDSPPAPVITGP